MRCMQLIGLPEGAEFDLHQNDKTTSCYTCGHESVVSFYEKKYYAFEEQFHSDGVDLYGYYREGRLCYKEVVQCTPWSSGPMVFLKLVDAEGKDVAVWTEEEIVSFGG